MVPAKQRDDATITTTNTLWEISYHKLGQLLDPIGYNYTNYQIIIANSTSIIVKIIYCFCVYVVVLYLFYI